MLAHYLTLSSDFPQKREHKPHFAYGETEAQSEWEACLSLGVAGTLGTQASAPPLPTSHSSLSSVASITVLRARLGCGPTWLNV